MISHGDDVWKIEIRDLIFQFSSLKKDFSHFCAKNVFLKFSWKIVNILMYAWVFSICKHRGADFLLKKRKRHARIQKMSGVTSARFELKIRLKNAPDDPNLDWCAFSSFWTENPPQKRVESAPDDPNSDWRAFNSFWTENPPQKRVKVTPDSTKPHLARLRRVFRLKI